METNPKKIFISIPYTGNYLETLDKMNEIMIMYFGWTVEGAIHPENESTVLVNTPIDESLFPNKIAALAARLNPMQMADEVIFAEGWENDNLCKIEYSTAIRSGLKIGFISLDNSLEIHTLQTDTVKELMELLKDVPEEYSLNYYQNTANIYLGIDHDNGMIALLTDEDVKNISENHSYIQYIENEDNNESE